MSGSFNIDYEWLSSEHWDLVDQSTLAELTINVGQWCATEVEDTFAKTVRSSVRLSALRLAEWFAFNWWRLLWEPQANTYSWRASHKVGNAGGGYVWPDLSFSSDWQSVLVSAHPTTRWEAEPIRYLSRFDELPIPIADFERAIDDFIDRTIARLSSLTNARCELSALWDEVVRERQDAEVSKRRIIEACIGYDPEEAPDSLLDAVIEQMKSYGANAVREMAAEYKDETTAQVCYIRENVPKNDAIAHVPKCDDIRQRFESESGDSNIPWMRAEHAARVARESWGLAVPISTEQFCDLFGIHKDRILTGQYSNGTRLTAGVRSDYTSDRFNVLLSRNHPNSRRFGLARLVGDHIVTDEEDVLLPATDSKTSRQKFQRAFAQELLCPFDELRNYLGDEIPSSDDVHDAADYFDVSPLMIQTMLVNKEVLSRESLYDWVT